VHFDEMSVETSVRAGVRRFAMPPTDSEPLSPSTEFQPPEASGVGATLGWPMGPAWVSTAWREEPGPVPSLVFVVLTRHAPNGLLVAAMAAVDRTCLGVRNAAVFDGMREDELEELLTALLSEEHPFEACEPSLVQSILFHAIDYARALGFEPSADFHEAFFGPRPQDLLEVPCARPSRPVYVAGARDAVDDVVAHLERVVGVGNYDVVAAAE
jgi:hypothetical protein